MLSPLPRTLCLPDLLTRTLSGHFSSFFRPPLKCHSLWGALRPPTGVRVSAHQTQSHEELTLRLSSGFHVGRGGLGAMPCWLGVLGSGSFYMVHWLPSKSSPDFFFF